MTDGRGARRTRFSGKVDDQRRRARLTSRLNGGPSRRLSRVAARRLAGIGYRFRLLHPSFGAADARLGVWLRGGYGDARGRGRATRGPGRRGCAAACHDVSSRISGSADASCARARRRCLRHRRASAQRLAMGGPVGRHHRRRTSRTLGAASCVETIRRGRHSGSGRDPRRDGVDADTRGDGWVPHVRIGAAALFLLAATRIHPAALLAGGGIAGWLSH